MVEIKSFEDRKKSLIELGKKNGFLTFEQLADALKGLEKPRQKRIIKKIIV